MCMAVTLLTSLVGVGDHRVFILDIDSRSLLGDMFPSVIPMSHPLLNCASDWIKISYLSLLNQLSNRHLLFKKLLLIDKESDSLSPASTHLQMNKVDLELEHFMKSVESDCHKYKRDNIKWLPYAGVWIHWQWLFAHMKKYLHGEIGDPHNLIRECHLRGVTNPQQISMDEFRMEYLVCKQILRFPERTVHTSI
jgi:hypothetical protein